MGCPSLQLHHVSDKQRTGIDTSMDIDKDKQRILKKNQVLVLFFWYQFLVCAGLFILLWVLPTTLIAVVSETNGYGLSLTVIGFMAGVSVLRWIVEDWIKMRLYNEILKQFDINLPSRK